MKVLFLPVSALAGMLAGMATKKLFGLVWSAIDGHEPPDPKQRVDDYRKLIAALALEGAISRVVRGGVDHASRYGYARMTGSWPGESD